MIREFDAESSSHQTISSTSQSRRKAPCSNTNSDNLQSWNWEERSNPRLVCSVGLTIEAHEIAFFQSDANQDVPGRSHGKQKMPHAHGRRSPERDNEPEHYRMAEISVETVGSELRMDVGTSGKVHPDLSKAKQVKVIDCECRKQDERPSCPKQGPYDDPRTTVVHCPNRRRKRPPLPIKEQKDQARQQHICTAFIGTWNNFGPSGFEFLPRHHAVLNRKER